jgi:hypothetical protein
MCTLLLGTGALYTAHLHTVYSSVFDHRLVEPVRGLLDAAVDSGMIVSGELDAHVIATEPAVASSDEALDYFAFADAFYRFASEDAAAPSFTLPVKHGKCARVTVVTHLGAPVADTALVPEPRALVPSAPTADPAAPPRYRLSVQTRGVERQVSAGVCRESPIYGEYGRKNGPPTLHNARLLLRIAPRVHHRFNVAGYMARQLHIAGVNLDTAAAWIALPVVVPSILSSLACAAASTLSLAPGACASAFRMAAGTAVA